MPFNQIVLNSVHRLADMVVRCFCHQMLQGHWETLHLQYLGCHSNNHMIHTQRSHDSSTPIPDCHTTRTPIPDCYMTHDFLMILLPASQPFVLVVGILLSVPLYDECGWRVAPICRQKVLWRLVVRANPLILSVQALDLKDGLCMQ